MTAASLRPYDEALLRRAFDVASRSRAAGDHPFGSVLADGEGRALMEQGNGYTSEGGDRTAHAERLLASRAARAYDLAFLARCTLYTSAEPCAMCAGAIYWAGIGRVVYGQTEKALKAQTGAHEENPTLDLPCGPSSSPPVSGRPKSSARCSRTKRLSCRRISGRRRNSRRVGRGSSTHFGSLIAIRLILCCSVDPEAGLGERWRPTRRVDGFFRHHASL